MKVVTTFDHLPPCAFTLGMLDGVHLGHQHLLRRLCSFGLPSVVLTFPNHPLSVLRGSGPKLITPLPVKLALLETLGIHTTIVAEFTRELAAIAFEELLAAVPAKQLVFGHGAVFGKGRLGNETAVKAWASTHSTGVEYLEKRSLDGQPISSSRIREAIAQGNFSLAETLLGHPHFLYIPEHTTRWDASDLVLPPDGAYSTIRISQQRWIELLHPIQQPLIPFPRNTP
jgi:riboflavin kinase/FMN adenylyltransferase